MGVKTPITFFLIGDKMNKKEIAVIKFIAANLNKMIIENESIPLTEVIEEPNRHPHYWSCVETSLFYDKEKECYIFRESRSGSPSCVNHYDQEIDSVFELAKIIIDVINEASHLLSKENTMGGYMEIEGF